MDHCTNTAPQPSPDLLAVDLLRVQIEGMGIEQLQAHIEALRGVLVALVESLHMRPHISPIAVANLHRLQRKVQNRLAEAFDLLGGLRAAAAWLDAARQASEEAGTACRPSRLDL